MTENFAETFKDEPNEERPSLSERMRREAEKIKEFLTPDRIQAALPTADLQKAFNAIKADTFSLHNIAVLDKQRKILEIQEKKILDQKIMRDFPAVYIGSSADLEYPLTLGARNIVMVDPELKKDSCLGRLKEKIRVLTNGKFVGNENCFNFKFDFGEGEEEVSVTVDPRPYVGKNEEIEGDRFTPPKEIGMLLAFQSEDPARDEEAVKNLIDDGYILTNRSLDGFVQKYFTENPEELKRFKESQGEERRPLLNIIYKHNQLEPIKLESFEGNYSETFLQKKGK